MSETTHKARRGAFLAQNPFPQPYTFGFFYREKMRAIHRVAPDRPLATVLEVGGGRSGLSALLFPEACVVNLDVDPTCAEAPCNRRPRVRFVVGDATRLPFPDASFDAVTMFDVIEHVPDDAAALSEALRVLRPGGCLLLSTPNERWRFPYYRFMRPLCPSEEAMFAAWGHVRRGYARHELEALVGLPARHAATFISPLTVLCHDVAFSRLPRRARRLACWALSPFTWLGYGLHRPGGPGTEGAYCWQKPAPAVASASAPLAADAAAP
jgi:SAM-dependent methyltransferase